MKTFNIVIVVLVVIGVTAGLATVVLKFNDSKETGSTCTAEAKLCSDGSAVGRSGPACEFAECPAPATTTDTDKVSDKSDLIVVKSPTSGELVSSPLKITGQARGYWFFEASFPVTLEDFEGNVIANGYASATDNWMTEEFVGFEAELNFTTAFTPATPDNMKKGVLILKKDNPSGLPENDDSLEIPVTL